MVLRVYSKISQWKRLFFLIVFIVIILASADLTFDYIV